MTGGVRKPEREALIASLSTLAEYQWMFLRNLYVEIADRLGTSGIAALERGLWRYGFYRGESLRNDPRILATGRDCLALLECWDGAELALAGPVGLGGTSTDLTVELRSVPGSEYLIARGGGDALRLHWENVLRGIAAGFDEEMSVEFDTVPTDGTSPWSVTFHLHGTISDRPAVPLSDPFDDPARYIRLARRTTGLIAAVEMYVAREIIHTFDASGEEAIRQACFGYGVERGVELRERVTARGDPADFVSLRSAVDARDPMSAVFGIGGEVYSSPGLDFYDCTYCPLAEVWAKEGSEGLALGYIFDMELHRGLIETYHPGAIVKWDALKTRGDSLCRFRFFIPELVTDDEQALVAGAPLPTPRSERINLRLSRSSGPPSATDLGAR
jgi:hypothetical protein